MELTKSRLESFSDGVIAIIITIMVLSIPLPDSFEPEKIFGFMLSIFIYFISFVVVGSFWNSHHRIFRYIDKLTNKVICYNLFYLFFLSLIPIFTKWVIENPGNLIPAIGYDLIYILVNLCYVLIFHIVVRTSERDEIRNMRERRKNAAGKASRQAPPISAWIRLIIIVGTAVAIIIISIAIPAVSTFFLLGLPVVFALINLFYDSGKHA